MINALNRVNNFNQRQSLLGQIHKGLFPVAMMISLFFSSQAFAFAQACQLVQQMAGSHIYQVAPNRVASMQSLNEMDANWKLQQIAQQGTWNIFMAPDNWFDKNQCAPQTRIYGQKQLSFLPVLINKETGQNAVISDSFIIQTYRKHDLNKVIREYGFMQLSPLPNPRASIVRVGEQQSYDLMIEQLDKDRDIELVLPVLIEP